MEAQHTAETFRDLLDQLYVQLIERHYDEMERARAEVVASFTRDNFMVPPSHSTCMNMSSEHMPSIAERPLLDDSQSLHQVQWERFPLQFNPHHAPCSNTCASLMPHVAYELQQQQQQQRRQQQQQQQPQQKQEQEQERMQEHEQEQGQKQKPDRQGCCDSHTGELADKGDCSSVNEREEMCPCDDTASREVTQSSNFPNDEISDQLNRFAHMFGVRDRRHNLNEAVVGPHALAAALKKRGMIDCTEEMASEMIREIFRAYESEAHAFSSSSERKRGAQSASIHLQALITVLHMENLPSMVHPDLAKIIEQMQLTLMGTSDIDEVVRQTTARHCGMDQKATATFEADDPDVQPVYQNILKALSVVVTCAIVLSVVMLGLSLDYTPEWEGWTIAEVACALTFLSELLVKLHICGCRSYFAGQDWRWNVFDALVTSMGLFDLLCTALARILQVHGMQPTSTARLSLMLRGIRLGRVFRLLRLLEIPLLHELSDMCAGIAIGFRFIIWILVFVAAVIYVVGVAMRQTVGPASGQAMIGKCGLGDDLTAAESAANPDCKRYILYGEEYFGTVGISCFTVFRCMMGDCSSVAGNSIIMELSNGYGAKFRLVYFIGMIVVVFGLFNTITALFVESTLSGLKVNGAKKRAARLYELRYVQRKLERLVRRAFEIQVGEKHKGRSIQGATTIKAQLWKSMSSLNTAIQEQQQSKDLFDTRFTEGDLTEILSDAEVKELLADIDVSVDMHLCTADVFGTRGDGTIDMDELVSTIIRLRGEIRKTDLVSSVMALRALHEKFSNVEFTQLEMYTKIKQNSTMMHNMFAQFTSPVGDSCMPKNTRAVL